MVLYWNVLPKNLNYTKNYKILYITILGSLLFKNKIFGNSDINILPSSLLYNYVLSSIYIFSNSYAFFYYSNNSYSGVGI